MKVLITGASSGIGEALAYEYARHKAEVALLARREEKLKEVAKQCLALGAGSVEVLVCDVTQSLSVKSSIQELWQKWKSLDVAIINAGVSRHELAHHLSYQSCEEIFSININGAIVCVLAALPLFYQQGYGHIVGVSSIAGFRGLPGSAAYCASKAALTTFLDALRPDVKKQNITVSIVSPGFIKTPLTEKNRFPMPFLMNAEKAAKKIMKGIQRKKAHIAFPWPMVSLMRLIRILPMTVYDKAMLLVVKLMGR